MSREMEMHDGIGIFLTIYKSIKFNGSKIFVKKSNFGSPPAEPRVYLKKIINPS